ncbi:MAG: enoyl-CoA hydratase-related protein [Gammaproteobacteria bacterium]|nr:enoyl-CoA hydratase-related protein [Gammaproteobacteria bacterium]MDH5303826.1 enoyl-CoA hydratase-related protein [Gammaproteobacteria bacterium]MDH5322311.1 enoyl-CoA hydratase-related protein [Gammaproteobacteria bacterium]
MPVLYTLQDHVARVTIDRADRMNAVDDATADELEAIWQRIEVDRDVRVVVLTGSGEKAFCAGADMKAGGNTLSGLEYWAHARAGGFGGLALRKSLHVPVIARVNGLAVGGGFELVLGCDIVIAAEHASFGLPEARVGRMPVDGGMILLPRMIPQKVAMGMLLTGRRISAAEAMQYGLVNEVVPPEQLDEAVNRWLAEILECAPLSVKAIKECVKETSDLSIDEAQAKRLPSLIAALQSEDADEGPRAFREKRKPDWKGR